MATDADRLLNAGYPVTLADGTVRNIRYTFRGIKYLEDTFGSLKAVGEVMDKAQGGDGKILSTVGDIAVGGMIHSRSDDPDRLLDLLDPARLQEYAEAAIKALNDALPGTSPNAAAPAVETTQSTGETVTTSAPSFSVAAMPSSGT